MRDEFESCTNCIHSDDADRCYECTGYGDDYVIDDDGELVRYCPECPFNPDREEEGEADD